jgi:hypothetical protein
VRRIVLVVVLALATSTAHADGSKSRNTARALSAIGTGVASLLVLGGFMLAPEGQNFDKPLLYTGLATAVVAPSLGEWYAGEWLTYGMAARVFAAGIATVALTTEMKTVTCPDATTTAQTCTELQGGGFALLGVAALAAVGGMAYDVTDAPDAAGRWNARHGFTATIVPTAFVTPSGNVPGLALSGHF